MKILQSEFFFSFSLAWVMSQLLRINTAGKQQAAIGVLVIASADGTSAAVHVKTNALSITLKS